jgi:hypothetical protein
VNIPLRHGSFALAAVTAVVLTLVGGSLAGPKAVRNGAVQVALPRTLEPGKHVVAVRYLGSPAYAASSARRQTLTVTRRR